MVGPVISGRLATPREERVGLEVSKTPASRAISPPPTLWTGGL